METRKGLKNLGSMKTSKVYIVYEKHFSKITITPSQPNCNNLSCFKAEQILGRYYRKAQGILAELKVSFLNQVSVRTKSAEHGVKRNTSKRSSSGLLKTTSVFSSRFFHQHRGTKATSRLNSESTEQSYIY